MATGLADLGFEIIEDFESSKEQMESTISDVSGIVIRSRFPLDKEFLEKAVRLSFIGRVGAGLENIDLLTANRLGIKSFNAPEGNRDAVGEHALGMLLMLFNHLKKADAEVRKGIWKREENRGLEISGKTVGIIGYGNMGSAFAEKLRGLGCEILAYDKYKKGFENGYAKEVSLKEIQAKSDILSLHIPQTEETIGMVNENFIKSFKKDFYLINTARGKIVKTSALVNALNSGKISGACLDVLEYESSSFENLFGADLPGDFNHLTQAENVILSPHVAGWTAESKKKMAQIILGKIKRFWQNVD